jgi:hypothetical protein
VAVHFQDPAINWEQVSDAFVKQFLVDEGSNQCLEPSLSPERMLGNPERQTHVGSACAKGYDLTPWAGLRDGRPKPKADVAKHLAEQVAARL